MFQVPADVGCGLSNEHNYPAQEWEILSAAIQQLTNYFVELIVTRKIQNAWEKFFEKIVSLSHSPPPRSLWLENMRDFFYGLKQNPLWIRENSPVP